MGALRCCSILVLLLAVIVAVIIYFCPCCQEQVPPVLKDAYFGRGPLLTDPTKFPKDDVKINKMVIKVEESVLTDLKDRLNRTRFVDPLDNVEFQYGFHADQLKEVVNYWLTKFDWRKQEKELNKFDHFTTQIEGITIHYIHQKPDVKGKKVRVLPLLLSHGWPSSFVEFIKILPLLTTPREDRDYVFEVICPSVPGFGYSEAPHQPGFGVSDAARVYSKLMTRLGFEQFYVQGSDYSSAILSTIAKVYPQRVTGVHLNMYGGYVGLFAWVKYAIGYMFPDMYTNQVEYNKFYPLKKFLGYVLEESGYFHIQATKPDTIGAGLTDSPAGLAAYILEKFSAATNRNNVNEKDGGLTKKFTMDELLTNVMIYWTRNNIASSVRIYKEYLSEEERQLKLDYVPLKVPTGISAFPHDFVFPEAFHMSSIAHLIRYTRMPRGGHFAAMEEPELMSNDIFDFILDVENFAKEKAMKKTEI